MYRVTALSRAAVVLCLAAFLSFLPNQSAQAQGSSGQVNWTGFYIGGHTGYSWTDIDFPGKNPYVAPPKPCTDPVTKLVCGPPRQELSGAFLGGQIGANYQMGAIVVGVEADLSKANLTGSVRDGNYLVQTDTIEMTGTLRGRLGFAMGRFLPYATAGIMWERSTRGQSCPGDPKAVVAGHCSTAGPYSLSNTQTHSGFVYGAGVEYAISQHWSLKVEGLRADTGDQTYTLAPDANGKTANVSKIEHQTTTMRVGVNYKF